MNRVLLFAAIIIFGDSFLINAYNVASEARRSMVNDFLWKGAAMTGVALYHPPEARANEATEESPPVPLESIYVGGGCFWHLQHSVAVFERDTLGRGGGQLTCKTGYAGGKKKDKEGRVCYHNTNNIADYGKLGHGEVVGVELPSDRIVDATKLYFSQFNPKTKGTSCVSGQCNLSGTKVFFLNSFHILPYQRSHRSNGSRTRIPQSDWSTWWHLPSPVCFYT